MNIQKRDGQEVPFDINKIKDAVFQAAKSVDGTDEKKAMEIAIKVKQYLESGDYDIVSVEDIQDAVETILIEQGHVRTAKSFILYRRKRTNIRKAKTVEQQIIKQLISTDAEDLDAKRENANIDGNSAMGSMLKIGGTVTSSYFLNNIERDKHREMHEVGIVHQHDLDFAMLCTNCLQIPLGKLLKSGFNTGTGSLRPPTTIGTAATQMCILIQSSQNDFFGGQGIPTLDYDLAPYVAKSYIYNCAEYLSATMRFGKNSFAYFKKAFVKPMHEQLMGILPDNRIMNKYGRACINAAIFELYTDRGPLYEDVPMPSFELMHEFALEKTEEQVLQAMESITHNLCTLNSRAGGQVPFSSVNFGTDTSVEGRMISKGLLTATDKGLGNGETPIFPISIMKMKKGITDKGSPNYDIFQQACAVSAKRLFPNFVNLDASYNLEYYRPGRPETEVATMGCRTRVIGNIYDPDKAITPGRGNIFPITMNLTYLALEAKESGLIGEDLLDLFYSKITSTMEDIFDMIDDRFEILCKRKAKNFPFAYGQRLVLGSETLKPNDSIREVMKHGTLVTGFIGLAETLKVLVGAHHGESEEAQELGLAIVEFMNDITKERALETGLNYSLMASPAEGCCGRLLQCTRKRFGMLEGITDKAYLTNSFHVPVYFPITAAKKIAIEAPYHALCPAGHISYVEVDGDPTKNLGAFEKLITHMADSNMGYFSINHPVDRDPVCGYVGVIGDVCPRCGRREGEAVSLEHLESLPIYQPDTQYRVS